MRALLIEIFQRMLDNVRQTAATLIGEIVRGLPLRKRFMTVCSTFHTSSLFHHSSSLFASPERVPFQTCITWFVGGRFSTLLFQMVFLQNLNFSRVSSVSCTAADSRQYSSKSTARF